MRPSRAETERLSARVGLGGSDQSFLQRQFDQLAAVVAKRYSAPD